MAWIQTFTGKKFPMHNPNPTLIDIEDIAHALSLLCRFNGHCTRFYSVRVAREIYPALAMVGLLNDAAEAYLGDMPLPFKAQLPRFNEFEWKMGQAMRTL